MSMRFKPAASLSHAILLRIPLLMLLAAAAGCGVVSKDSLDIRSEPEGAFVYVNGKFVGNSPLDLRLNRQVPHRVEVRKAGFVSEEVMVFPSYDESQKPTVIFGPLREAGYYRDLQPNPVEVSLLYEALAEADETLTGEEADRLLRRIQSEVEAGEMTESEAALAEQQVLARVE